MAEGKRIKITKNSKEYEVRKMPFSEIAELSDSLVEVLFFIDEKTGEMTFLYPYKEVVIRRFEMAGVFPGVVDEDMDISEFADNYFDSVYDDYISILDDDPRIRYLEDSINAKIDNIMRYNSTTQLLGNVNKLVTTITSTVEKYSANLENINPEDMKAFLNNFGEFAEKANPKSMSEAIIKMHKETGTKKKSPRKSSAKTKGEVPKEQDELN